MKCYIAGPMTGVPFFNFPAFDAAAERLRAIGYSVFNPADRDRQKYGPYVANPEGDPKIAASKWGFSLREALAADMDWLCREAEAIALLPGWENSKGARAERAVAKALGLKVILL